jgi:SpoVK/Ycf46/Vps4 family AAA+-type ATPase
MSNGPDSGARAAGETVTFSYVVRLRVSKGSGDDCETRVRAALRGAVAGLSAEGVEVEWCGVDLMCTQREDDVSEALRASVARSR